MAVTQGERERLAEMLYERYGKPLEAAHRGEYVAISPAGETVLAASVLDAVRRGVQQLGRGCYIFKVGEKAVYRWR